MLVLLIVQVSVRTPFTCSVYFLSNWRMKDLRMITKSLENNPTKTVIKFPEAGKKIHKASN